MHTFIRTTRTVLAGAFLAGVGLLGGIPMAGAHAASSRAPGVVCSQTATAGWICFLRYCDEYYCYYDCYPTLAARNKGDRPSDTIRVPKPEGTPPAQIERP